MTILESRYTLKRFTSTSDDGYSEALRIYAKNVSPIIKTDTNQISYWLNNYSKLFNDDFFVFGFYCNNEISGFAEFAYFKDERIVVVDYLVVDKTKRSPNVYFEFISHIKDYIEGEGIDYLYIVTEVLSRNDVGENPYRGFSMVRLLRFSGFGAVTAPYYQPMLGDENSESEAESILLIYSGDSGLDSIKINTYLEIVRTIYFKHYFRWYDPMVKDKAGYATYLSNLLDNIKSKLKGVDEVGIDGLKDAIGYAQSTTKRKTYYVRKILAALFVILLIIGMISVGFYLKYEQKLDDKYFIILVGISLLSAYIVAALLSDRALFLGEKIAKMLKPFFGK